MSSLDGSDDDFKTASDDALTPKSKARSGSVSSRREFLPVKLSADTLRLAQFVGMEAEVAQIRKHVILPIKYPNCAELSKRQIQNVLCYGTGGTGKTALARAVAMELNYHYIPVKPSDICDKLSGEDFKKFQCLISSARKLASDKSKNGVLILFDEADILLADQAEVNFGCDQTIGAEFKATLPEGHAIENNVIIWANTNVPRRITDPGVLRRFGVKIYCGLPGTNSRLQIIRSALAQHFHQPCQQEDLDVLFKEITASWSFYTSILDGYSPYELQQIVSNAANSGACQFDNCETLKFQEILSPDRSTHRPLIFAPLSPDARAPRNTSLMDMSIVESRIASAKTTGRKAYIKWPICDLQDLRKAIRSGEVKRSVSVPVLEQYHSYALHTLGDRGTADRIQYLINSLQKSQVALVSEDVKRRRAEDE
jgi:SpoVK/Ycf46/Vps4 family AAA+-type ATPase